MTVVKAERASWTFWSHSAGLNSAGGAKEAAVALLVLLAAVLATVAVAGDIENKRGLQFEGAEVCYKNCRPFIEVSRYSADRCVDFFSIGTMKFLVGGRRWRKNA
jgi:hypothetical protein